MRKYNLNFFGGFFTGISVIIFFSVITYYSYIFVHGNLFENISLVSSSTIINKKDFEQEKLKIQVGFISLRNINCKTIKPDITSSNKLFTIISKSRQRASNCIIEVIVNKKGVFQSGDFIEFLITCQDCYTSDASVSVEANAAYHKMKSRATSNISLTDGLVFKGNQPIRFFFELSPAIFDDLTERNQKREFGYRVSSLLSPERGSTSDLSLLYFNANIKVRIEFTLSQTGVYTAQMQKNDNFGFISMAFGALTGSIAGLILIMKISEFFYIKFKYRNKKTISKYKLYFEYKNRENCSKEKSYSIDEKIIENESGESPQSNLEEIKLDKTDLEKQKSISSIKGNGKENKSYSKDYKKDKACKIPADEEIIVDE